MIPIPFVQILDLPQFFEEQVDFLEQKKFFELLFLLAYQEVEVGLLL